MSSRKRTAGTSSKQFLWLFMKNNSLRRDVPHWQVAVSEPNFCTHTDHGLWCPSQCHWQPFPECATPHLWKFFGGWCLTSPWPWAHLDVLLLFNDKTPRRTLRSIACYIRQWNKLTKFHGEGPSSTLAAKDSWFSWWFHRQTCLQVSCQIFSVLAQYLPRCAQWNPTHNYVKVVFSSAMVFDTVFIHSTLELK